MKTMLKLDSEIVDGVDNAITLSKQNQEDIEKLSSDFNTQKRRVNEYQIELHDELIEVKRRLNMYLYYLKLLGCLYGFLILGMMIFLISG